MFTYSLPHIWNSTLPGDIYQQPGSYCTYFLEEIGRLLCSSYYLKWSCDAVACNSSFPWLTQQ